MNHNSAHNHIPGCTLKCSCGVWNAQSQFQPMQMGKEKGRSRLNSESSPSKSPHPPFSLPKIFGSQFGSKNMMPSNSPFGHSQTLNMNTVNTLGFLGQS